MRKLLLKLFVTRPPCAAALCTGPCVPQVGRHSIMSHVAMLSLLLNVPHRFERTVVDLARKPDGGTVKGGRRMSDLHTPDTQTRQIVPVRAWYSREPRSAARMR